MTETCFVDTNILFYSVDNDGSVRHRQARELLARLPADRFYVSTQVLLELASATRNKLKLTGNDLLKALDFNGVAHVLITTADDVMAAVRLMEQASISIWDAMIVVAPAKGGCDTLYTEDLNHGQVIAGVRVVNPFRTATAPE